MQDEDPAAPDGASELQFPEVLDVLASLKGKDVSVLISATETRALTPHPIVIFVGTLGEVEMSEASDAAHSWSVAQYQVGSGARFAVDSTVFRGAGRGGSGSLMVDAGGCMLQIECPPIPGLGLDGVGG